MSPWSYLCFCMQTVVSFCEFISHFKDLWIFLALEDDIWWDNGGGWYLVRFTYQWNGDGQGERFKRAGWVFHHIWHEMVGLVSELCSAQFLIYSSKFCQILWLSTLYSKFHFITGFCDSVFRIKEIIVEGFCLKRMCQVLINGVFVFILVLYALSFILTRRFFFIMVSGQSYNPGILDFMLPVYP